MGTGIQIEELARQADRLNIQIIRFENTIANIHNKLDNISNYLSEDPGLQSDVIAMAESFNRRRSGLVDDYKTVQKVMKNYVTAMTENNSELRAAVNGYNTSVDNGRPHDVAVKNGNHTVYGELPKNNAGVSGQANTGTTVNINGVDIPLPGAQAQRPAVDLSGINFQANQQQKPNVDLSDLLNSNATTTGAASFQSAASGNTSTVSSTASSAGRMSGSSHFGINIEEDKLN